MGRKVPDVAIGALIAGVVTGYLETRKRIEVNTAPAYQRWCIWSLANHKEKTMIHRVVSYLFEGMRPEDVAWTMVVILAVTHPAMAWLWNMFGKRSPSQR